MDNARRHKGSVAKPLTQWPEFTDNLIYMDFA